MHKIGILLVNLGTPNAPTTTEIRRYLRPFLSDKRVIDIPRIFRYLLLYGVILPFRPRKIVESYKTIWSDQGSPLLQHTKQLTDKVSHMLGASYQVEYAMRYGSPSISSALHRLSACEEICVVPLYPQYATSSTGSTIAHVMECCAQTWDPPQVRFAPAFYGADFFIHSVAHTIRQTIETHDFKLDHLLMSYHGIPQRHLLKTGCQKIKSSCAEAPCSLQTGPKTARCYRQQCYISSDKIAQATHIKNYSVSFQSRLGRTPWIKPYTDIYIEKLYQQGVRNLAVVCPSFVADCLETIEEVGIRLQEDWLQMPGTTFLRIPCVNSRDDFSTGLAAWLQSSYH
ncbi:MAG: ferrochelatase [Zetaproteobacteria bacterium]|nr:ferrochelatase [Zetaproteobacteria bacterium]